MNLSADQITIAVTVYDRREYLKTSIGSALAQTVPVRVMVIEDCGPDPAMELYVRSLFGQRVGYFRSAGRRGIFGNWNACIEQCPTPWLSILHDDDWLEPGFIAAILELARQSGNRGLYFGRTTVVDNRGKPKAQWEKPPSTCAWAPVELQEVVLVPPFSFPGQLFRTAYAKQLGGFRETSLFCGEWELWSKITANYGAAKTSVPVACFRDHDDWSRGTNRMYRTGKIYALIAVQTKRNLALARSNGVATLAELKANVRFTLPIKYLLRYGSFFSSRMVAYNLARIQRSRAPHWRYALLQRLLRLVGRPAIRLISRLWLAAGRLWARTHGFH
jgi:glycosyltransferase involved in cell wall biosynthesis